MSIQNRTYHLCCSSSGSWVNPNHSSFRKLVCSSSSRHLPRSINVHSLPSNASRHHTKLKRSVAQPALSLERGTRAGDLSRGTCSNAAPVTSRPSATIKLLQHRLFPASKLLPKPTTVNFDQPFVVHLHHPNRSSNAPNNLYLSFERLTSHQHPLLCYYKRLSPDTIIMSTTPLSISTTSWRCSPTLQTPPSSPRIVVSVSQPSRQEPYQQGRFY